MSDPYLLYLANKNMFKLKKKTLINIDTEMHNSSRNKDTRKEKQKLEATRNQFLVC